MKAIAGPAMTLVLRARCASPAARVAALLAVLAAPALATDVELKNDGIVNFSSIAVQGGFVETETGAVVLSALPGEYPVTLKELRVWVDRNVGTAPTSMTARLHVWDVSTASGASPSMGSALYTSPDISLFVGAFNTWDVSAENIVLNGPFLVGCEIIDNAFIGLFQGNQPNLVTDTNGCQGGKNFVRAKQLNGSFLWQNLCSFGVSGDLGIRALVSTGSGTGQFLDLGSGLAGNFAPGLTGSGSLVGGASFQLDFANMPPSTTGTVFVGFIPLFVPFKGGVLGPDPFLLLSIPTVFGGISLPSSMPVGIPSGSSIYLQGWFPDAGGPQGVSATNVLELLTP